MESLHEGALEAVSERASIGDRVIDLLSAVGPDFSVATDLAFDSELGNRVKPKAGVACNGIEAVAAANGIDADFGCGTLFR